MKTLQLCVPRPIQSELLSSYMTRLAHQHGLSAYRFFSYWLPGVPVWNRDLDRSISDHSLDLILEVTQLDRRQLELMTLRDYERQLSGLENAPWVCRQGIAPWLNAVGVYHRTRRRFGLQYCPECLVSKDAAFIKPWRLAFVTMCPIHARWLLDCCTKCGGPIVPHRNNVSPLRCQNCHSWLSSCREDFSMKSGITDALLNIQQKYQNLSGHFHVGSEEIAHPEVLRGLHLLMPVLRAHRFRFKSRCKELLAEAGTGPIELTRVWGRAEVLLFLDRILVNWPDSFRTLALQAGITQQTFNPNKTIPPWLSVEVERLPVETMKRHLRKNTERVSSQANKEGIGSSWRSARAAMLVKLAGL